MPEKKKKKKQGEASHTEFSDPSEDDIGLKHDGIFGFLGAVGMFGIVILIDYLYPGLQQYVIEVSRLGGLLFVLVVGIGLYVLRTFARFYFGLLEIVFALVIGYFAIGKYELSGFNEAAAVIGAIYFVVRGLDNVFASAKEELEKSSGLNPSLPTE